MTEQWPQILKEFCKVPRGTAPCIEVKKFEATRPGVTFVPRPGKYPQAFQTAKKPFEELRDDLPVLMLPVRIETRFHGPTQDRTLRIRVYPDMIGVDAFDPTITQPELKAARQPPAAAWK